MQWLCHAGNTASHVCSAKKGYRKAKKTQKKQETLAPETISTKQATKTATESTVDNASAAAAETKTVTSSTADNGASEADVRSNGAAVSAATAVEEPSASGSSSEDAAKPVVASSSSTIDYQPPVTMEPKRRERSSITRISRDKGGDVGFLTKDLVKKLGLLTALVAASRVGVYDHLYGVDIDKFSQTVSSNGILGYIDNITGGSISNVGVFTLGIIPAINASIFLQVCTISFPGLKKMAREDGPQGRARYQLYQKLATLGFAIAQAVTQLNALRYALQRVADMKSSRACCVKATSPNSAYASFRATSCSAKTLQILTSFGLTMTRSAAGPTSQRTTCFHASLAMVLP